MDRQQAAYNKLRVLDDAWTRIVRPLAFRVIVVSVDDD
jgi:hypothetical protein